MSDASASCSTSASAGAPMRELDEIIDRVLLDRLEGMADELTRLVTTRFAAGETARAVRYFTAAEAVERAAEALR